MSNRRYFLLAALFSIILSACSPTTTNTSPNLTATPLRTATLAPQDATRDPDAPLPFDDVDASADTSTQGTFAIAVGASSVVLPNIGGNWTGGDFTTTNTDIGLVLRADIVRGVSGDQTALAYAQETYPTGTEAEQIASTDFFVKRDAVSETTRVGRKIDSTTLLILSFNPLSDATVLDTQFDVFVQMLRDAQVQ